MVYLVSYDIEEDRKRKRVADRLLADGLIRVQYSVFIGPLKSHLHEKLLTWLSQLLDKPEKDRLIIMNMRAEDIEKMHILGEVEWEPEMLSGKQHTLFL